MTRSRGAPVRRHLLMCLSAATIVTGCAHEASSSAPSPVPTRARQTLGSHEPQDAGPSTLSGSTPCAAQALQIHGKQIEAVAGRSIAQYVITSDTPCYFPSNATVIANVRRPAQPRVTSLVVTGQDPVRPSTGLLLSVRYRSLNCAPEPLESLAVEIAGARVALPISFDGQTIRLCGSTLASAVGDRVP